jgi:hypothetical protein
MTEWILSESGGGRRGNDGSGDRGTGESGHPGIRKGPCHSERSAEGAESRNRDRPDREPSTVQGLDSSTAPLRGSARNDSYDTSYDAAGVLRV